MAPSLVGKIWLMTPAELDEQRAWIEQALATIGEETLQALAAAALDARSRAYAPYSTYQVGAAVLCLGGAIYAAPNVEVVSLSETDHAEQAAITRAVAEGEVQRSGRRFVRALAVAGPGQSGPCGRCRQKLQEHADNAVVLKVLPGGEIAWVTSLGMYLPRPFTPAALGVA